MPAHEVRGRRGRVGAGAARRAGPLAAAALGRAAGGRVVSVHRRAVNVALADGSLVALLAEGTPLHPWAVTAALEAALVVGGRIELDLAGADVVDLALRTRTAAPPAAAVAAVARRRPPPAGDPFAPVLERALAAFAAGGPARDPARLVGLGGGLTPSGDDALVGVLAALDLTGARALRAELVAALEPALPERTPRLSAQMLAAAAAGLYPEPLVDLLEAVARPETAPASLARAVDAVLALGHRSGADLLAGVAAALGRPTRARVVSPDSAPSRLCQVGSVTRTGWTFGRAVHPMEPLDRPPSSGAPPPSSTEHGPGERAQSPARAARLIRPTSGGRKGG